MRYQTFVARNAAGLELEQLHRLRLQWLEQAEGDVFALATLYPSGHHIPDHHHIQAQLLHAISGVAMVTTKFGRWMVPPHHALWLPAGVEHAVDMLGDVSMHSIYVRPDAVAGLKDHLHVVGLTPLMDNLIREAVAVAPERQAEERTMFVMGLLLHEIPNLEERPLGLPFPEDRRLAMLCRGFLKDPSPHTNIDNWADRLGMSRRTFTRMFRRETGLSLSTWRQQACLLAALPRLTEGEPVTSVALDLGYSVPAFTTMFKRMLGAPPRHYLHSAA
ncbi:transcriptional regulator, AraC family [Phyllobacterium sp. YR620]|uniref:Helix-turn-helix transcriptional regulator n=1 Tax=Phyllobacterium pellucidum TaxID=2740464 RepID=A0A849VZ15_9HYPH|nr:MULTISPECIES: helix-turn-helix transcriptional regulator [Phyllobacterium]NTS33140.1 helix-turn-helix transcriptional regulator [Phyllobacterium pellucidum]SDP86289.1 transcriptional regulator, AraC family [Phyllobacterium sp. YR620]SFJ27944.1 AraC-type DNA-binding protein [Phyllobacterium sp. CL33Tsu]